MKKVRQVDLIPAQPGFNLATPWFEQGQNILDRTPIIAWRIVTWIPEEQDEHPFSFPEPITVSMIAEQIERKAVETPKGHFWTPNPPALDGSETSTLGPSLPVWSMDFDNEADLLDYWRKRWPLHPEGRTKRPRKPYEPREEPL